MLYLTRVIGIAKRLKTPFATVFIKLFLRTLYFALLLIAMLGPSFGGSKKEVKSIGKDIMICVDLSKSMDAYDIQPTRLEKIKHEMKKLVQAFNSDRIGVIIFGAEAFMQCPLTYDQNALNLFIETMNTSLVPASGTDFGPPLRMALKKLQDEAENASQAKSKVIILISDGEDFGEETNDIAKDIDQQDIKLFTLGIGTERGGNIYAGTGVKKDREGNAVLTKLNSSSLKSLANKTGGQYFEINETKNDISRLINTISKIEGELRDARYVDVTANKYIYFLAAAALLFALDILINIRTVRI
ncbi:VWA domain-containing protein [Fulvivirgaceae bacterium PWU4]|uniref:VWA domain-containing protein n=2 Tax=Chryseosolibacter histidini TaxID=2782349 RepID=A0AAP2DKX3_9BACT|nr:VWA domain-containing protein [Chryseosolibacter histidini]